MSEEIEPAAVMKVCDTCNYIEYVMPTRQAYARQGDVDDCAENDMKEVLTVRVSDVLDDLERAQMAAQERSESADELLRQKLKRLRENGLNSPTEDDEN